MEGVLEKYPCRGVAVELNTSLARVAQKRLAKYEPRVKVISADVCNLDLREATAVIIYFISTALVSIRGHLESSLKPGCILMNYNWPVPGWVTSRPPQMASSRM